MQQLGTKLNRLIKDRSYTAGRRARLETEKQRLIARITEIDTLQRDLDASLSHIDTQIQAVSAINAEHIRATKPCGHISKASHGKVIQGVIDYFRRNSGRSIRTDELQRVVAELSGFTGGPRTKLSARTAEMCFVLKRRGWLERLPDSPEPELGRVFGVWRWVGNEAMNAVDKARGLNHDGSPTEALAAVVEPVNGDAR